MYRNNDYFRKSFSWVLINELSLGIYPRNLNDLTFLKDNKIKSILTLCDEDEALIPKEIEDMFFHQKIVLPDHKSREVLTINKLNETMKILKKLLEIGPLYVHCFAAMERSPLICMAWLVKKLDLTPQESLEYLQSVHKLTNPLPDQIKLLYLITNV